jgi:DNA repair exonuclease SbcCD nuclease subunit
MTEHKYNYRFIGDIHLDKRLPYTTLRTAEKFDRLRANTVDKATTCGNECIQLGDLFDDFNVSAEVFCEGFMLAKRMKATLVGNHDLSKNTDRVSSLHLLNRPFGIDVATSVTSFKEGMTTFHMIPHQLTQEKFEGALTNLIHNYPFKSARFHVLCLHCNWGEHRGAEGDNYLPAPLAKALFDAGVTLIVSGHEHNYREPMKGVVMVGSILPYSFGEMETKYVLDYDTQTGVYARVPVWEASRYVKLSCKDFLENDIVHGVQFIEVTGDIDVEQAALLNRKTNNLFRNSDDIIAIKNSTIVHRHTKAAIENKAEHWLSLLLKQCNTEEQRAALRELAGEQE